MSLQLVQLDSVPEIVFQRDAENEIPGFEKKVQNGTTECFVIARDSGQAICVIGVRPYALLGKDAVMWALWFEESQPTRGEFREGRRLMEEWFKAQEGVRVAEVREGDTIGERFVEWLGFHSPFNWAGFNIYRRG